MASFAGAAMAAIIGGAAAPLASADSGPILLDQAGTELAYGNSVLDSTSSEGLAPFAAASLQGQEAFQTYDLQSNLSVAQSIQDSLSSTLQSNTQVVDADEQLVTAFQAVAAADQAIAADPSALGTGFDGFGGFNGVGDPFALEFQTISADFGALWAGAQVDEVDFYAVVDPALLPFASFDPIPLFSL